MEYDNHKDNDQLGDFLKKALGDFEKTPSDAVWSRLSENLQTPTAPDLRITSGVKKWHLAAACIAGIAACALQYFYLSDQIQQLESKVDAQNSTIATLVESEKKKQWNNGLKTPGIHSSTETYAAQTYPPAAPSSVYSFSSNKNAYSSKNLILNNEQGVISNTSINPILPNIQLPIQNEVSSLNTATETLRPTKSNLQPVFLPVLKRPSQLYRMTSTPVVVNNSGIIRKSLPFKQWSVGVVAGSGTAYAQISEKENPFMGGPPKGHDRIFVDESLHKSEIKSIGLSVKRGISNRVSLVSGLEYAGIKGQKTITPSLRFEDRDSQGGGNHHDHEHDFNYYLGTNSGSSQVDVVLMERDTNQQIPSEESVDFEITTNTKMTKLSIPAAVQYHFVKGNWNLFVLGGLRLNTTLQNSESIGDFQCKSDRFDIIGQPKLTPANTKKIQIETDAIAAVGVEYRFGKLGIQLSPVLSMPLRKHLEDPKVDVKSYAASLNAGIQYYF